MLDVTPAYTKAAATLMKALEAIQAYGSRHINQKPSDIKVMVAFLFIRPECKIAQESIIPNLRYYNQRSSDQIDIFFLDTPTGMKKDHVNCLLW